MNLKNKSTKEKESKTVKSLDFKQIKEKMFSVKGIRVIGAVALGGILVLSSQYVNSHAADQKNEKVAEWNVTAGISSELTNAEGMLRTSGASITQTDTVMTAASEVSEEATAVSEPAVETAPKEDVKQQITGYTNLGVANVDNYLNIREEADEGGKLCGKLPQNAGCEILEETSGWYKIKSGKVTGYVKSEYLLTGDAAWQKADEVKVMTATVTTDTLYVREQMNTDCKILTLIPEDEELDILELNDGWAKVEVDREQGYISTDYVSIGYKIPKAVAMTELETSSGVSSTRVSIVEYAKQFLGNPYVWGGTSLTKGADCSGFTMSIYAKYGVSLPHSSSSQSHMGTKVKASEAKPGDLFFYGSGGSVSHVAMYIGNGLVIHASTERTGIKISNAFYRTPITVRRFLSE